MFEPGYLGIKKSGKMKHELLHKLKEGDENAWHVVFNSYFPGLVAFANKYVSDLDLAKEIVQVVFVKLFEKRTALEITVGIKPYLYKMVYNDCLNVINGKKIVSMHHSLYARQIDLQVDFQDAMEQTEKEQRIFNAINQLPPQCRLIIQQSRFEGKKNQVIADELNISIRTVETQISKALKLLRAAINLFF
jgi:RNA polymerase sigma-70 factor (ECF subfamily)